MPGYTTEDIRNVALIGHGGSGKTMLAEAMLHKAGATNELGSIARGNTVLDFDPQEKLHEHSLNAAIASLDHRGKHINLIDTPGYPDFLGRAISVLPAAETAALVIDARSGIEMNTRRMMEAAQQQGLCRMIIVTKIDSEDLALPELLEEIAETFGQECLPINLPTNNGQGVVDCFFNPSGDAADFSSVDEAHTQIVDQVVEVDETLMELYLEQGEEIDPKQLHDPFGKALREGHLIPVCFTSSESGAGVPELLEVLAHMMPNPKEGNPPPFRKGEGDDAEAVVIEPDPQKHALAHVFKIAIDPFVGRLGVFRIHQGTITKDSQLFIGDGRKPFKVGHLLKLQGRDHVEVDSGIPGDICAVGKIDDNYFNSV